MKRITANPMTVGEMSEEDRKNFAEWVWASRALNCFDMEVVSYPKTVMVRADAPEGAVLYVPLQSVLLFESLAPKPGISPRMEALALYLIGEKVSEMALHTGHREVYFFCKDDRVAEICKRHDFEEMTGYRVLRRKIKEPEAEPQQETQKEVIDAH